MDRKVCPTATTSLHFFTATTTIVTHSVEGCMHERGESKLIVDFFGIFVLIFIINCYGIGNNVWKFQVSTMKIVPVARVWSICVIRMMIYRFYKGDFIW